jgi:hypothetical protein
MQEPQCVVFGPFRLDLRDERLWRGEVALHLHPKTLAVLRALVARAGQLMTKDALFVAVWPETAVSESVTGSAGAIGPEPGRRAPGAPVGATGARLAAAAACTGV